MLEAAKWTVLFRYHEFPAWNLRTSAAACRSGTTRKRFIAAPLAWITKFFHRDDPDDGVIWYIVHSALGFLSMWFPFSGRTFVSSRLACFIGSAMWAWNGFHQQHYGNGHATSASRSSTSARSLPLAARRRMTFVTPWAWGSWWRG